MPVDPPSMVPLKFPAADIALLHLNHPQAKNAPNDEMCQRPASYFQTFDADLAIRVIVLTGGSRCFAAGADLYDLSTNTATGLYGRHSERYWEAIAHRPKPVVVVVNGFALGSGCELAMYCDLIVAGESAQLAQPEIKVGVMPGAGGTQCLVWAVSKFRALRTPFAGCLVKAPQALTMGLISEVVADESTRVCALGLATEIARLSPLVLAQIREVVLAGAGLPLDNALALERKAFQLLFDSQDQKEGMHAFLEKRPPSYQGEQTTPDIRCIAVVGTGAMGIGITQTAAQAGLTVWLFDSRAEAAAEARQRLRQTFEGLCGKGKLGAADAETAQNRLRMVGRLEQLGDCELMVEAIVERPEAKQELLRRLEAIVAPETILAGNTSSLSITTIVAACERPQRVAGFHFFNPVPLVRVVEVIDGLADAPEAGDALLAFAARLGHRGVRTKDSPGFVVNHIGRVYGTEALRILGEGVAECAEIDRVLREYVGFRTGPFELPDLTGFDVSHPVMESIYQQYYQEPRYRPHPLTHQLFAAGRLGRKSGQGFYRRVDGQPQDKPGPQSVPQAAVRPPVRLGCENEDDRCVLTELLYYPGVKSETGERPSAAALCLLAAWGEDLSSAMQHFACPTEYSIGIDLFCDLERRRCLMLSPLTAPAMRDAAHALLAGDGTGITVLRDSPGFVVQRVLTMIVNLACDIAQQGIANAEDIDQVVHLSLGYPHGPLGWDDRLGPRRLLSILQRLQALTGDLRRRPSPWLRRRAQLGMPLCAGETAAADRCIGGLAAQHHVSRHQANAFSPSDAFRARSC